MSDLSGDRKSKGFLPYRLGRGAVVVVSGMILLSVGILSFGTYWMSQSSDRLREIARHDLPMWATVARITEYQLEQEIALERSLRYGEEMQSDPDMRSRFDSAVGRFELYARKSDEEFTAAGAIVVQVKQAAVTERGREVLVRADAALKELDANHEAYMTHAREVLVGLRENDAVRAMAGMKLVQAEVEDLDTGLMALSAELDAFTQAAARTAVDRERSAVVGMIVFLAAGSLGALAFAGFGGRNRRRISMKQRAANS